MVADGQIEFTDETACAESGKRVSQGDELLLQRGRRFAGLPMRGAGDFQQAAGTLLLRAAEPLANRGHGGGEQPRGGLDAALAGRFDQAKAMVISVFHLTYQIEVTSGSGHGAGSLLLARRPALPPAGRLSPSASSGSHTSIPLGGYDVSRLFQGPGRLDAGRLIPYCLWFTMKQHTTRYILTLVTLASLVTPAATLAQAASEFRAPTEPNKDWPKSAVRGAHAMVATDEELGSEAGVEIR